VSTDFAEPGVSAIRFFRGLPGPFFTGGVLSTAGSDFLGERFNFLGLGAGDSLTSFLLEGSHEGQNHFFELGTEVKGGSKQKV
jgi:hypothetical protein